MKIQSVLLALVLGTIVYLVGCGGDPEVIESLEPDISVLLQPGEEKVYHEWQRVYSVVNTSEGVVQNHVGFVDRRFTVDNPEGLLFVLDRTHAIRGLILPEGRAYISEKGPDQPMRFRSLGLTGQDIGLKKILDVPGGIKLQQVEAASTTLSDG